MDSADKGPAHKLSNDHFPGDLPVSEWPKVWAVVLNWRNAKMTAECVRTLEKCGYPNLEILIVDNGSEDGSPALLSREFPFLHHMHLPVNLGYAGGNAAGMQRALADPSTFAVLVINNDCVVTEGFLFPLVTELLDHPDTAAAGPVQLLYENDELVWANAGSRFSFWLARVVPDGLSSSEVPARGQRAIVEFHCGACALYRADALRRVGLLDPKLFLFGEEPDWSYRAAVDGWKTVVVTDSRVIHPGGRSTDTVPLAKTYYIYRNTSWLIRRHGSTAQIGVQVVRVLIGRGLRSVVASLLRGELMLAWAKLRGNIDGIVGDASRSSIPEEAALQQKFELEHADGALRRRASRHMTADAVRTAIADATRNSLP
ncbi:MAG: hypothetical protein C4318_06830 [Acidimicrobiia bacterium]